MKIVHIADIHWRGLSRHDEYTKSFSEFLKQTTEEPEIWINDNEAEMLAELARLMTLCILRPLLEFMETT